MSSPNTCSIVFVHAGTENPKTEERRRSAAVVPETGGSYVVNTCSLNMNTIIRFINHKIVFALTKVLTYILLSEINTKRMYTCRNRHNTSNS